MKALLHVFAFRRLLIGAVRAEIKARHAGSVLGLAWLILSPLLFLAFYSAVYLVIFRIRPNGMDSFSYVCHIMAGLLPFLSISESLGSATQAISSNREIFKNTVFPPDMLVTRTVIAAHVQLIVGLTMLIVLVICRDGIHLTFLLIPILLGFQIMFLVGICWLLSLVSLVFRDIQSILVFATMALMVSSPIAYTASMVPDGLKYFLWLNPFSHFISAYQVLVVQGESPSLASWAVVASLSFLSFNLGYFVFQRLKKIVANYA